MPVVVGVWFAIAGGVAALAGLYGIRRARRLRGGGVRTWGMAIRPPAPPDKEPDGSRGQFLIQYTLADGRVMERITPQPSRKQPALRAGQQVLVWYNPEDPDEVLIYGRETRLADRVFLAAGVLFILIGAGLAAF
jgi:Protein of unknown function (DUF3592)